MVPVMVSLLLSVLLTQTSASLPVTETETFSSCPPRWLLFEQRCFVFYPVWSTWSNAESVCSQVGGNLASLHTPEERRFTLQLLSSHSSVWLGGYQQQKNVSWFWSDGDSFSIRDWTNQGQGNTREGRACLQLDPKNGELNSAPCGELKFYICSTKASSTFSSNRKPVEPDLVPGVGLFDVLWSYSDMVAEEVLYSPFIKQMKSGQLTQRCYDSFIQQEALYLQKVSSTLEALISRSQEADDMRLLLQDSLKHYSRTNQTLLTSSPPPWLLWSLHSFHSVVLEDPVYLVVALSARSSLRSFLTREHRSGAEEVSGSEDKSESLYRKWIEGSLTEDTWTQRYSQVIEGHRDYLDVFKAVNIFREFMMNQRSFYKSLDCDEEDM
ncbi:uncharacterized protein LOC121504688 [Cheilinus undulatus]|uniref:uncharacterized protein LOC121504688 n=1 Tax=Cheilinus undulatus TaxID=241271 RepID=UPI001BD1F8F4|nr:uncharacterized protein LOC121504688 [Cheilinus undulatus]XP_041635634.1 uncharacterized protein LOC121504688 [Cheilinus undulatus]